MANKEKAHFWVRIVLNALLWILNKADKKDEVIDTLYSDEIKVAKDCKS